MKTITMQQIKRTGNTGIFRTTFFAAGLAVLMLLAGQSAAGDLIMQGPGFNFVNEDGTAPVQFFDNGQSATITVTAERTDDEWGQRWRRQRAELKTSGGCTAIDEIAYTGNNNNNLTRSISESVTIHDGATERCVIEMTVSHQTITCRNFRRGRCRSWNWPWQVESYSATAVWKVNREIVWTDQPSGSEYYVGTVVSVAAEAHTVGAGAVSTGNATLTSLNTAVCSLSGTNVTHIAPGTCTIRAQVPETGDLSAASDDISWQVLAKEDQTISHSAPAEAFVGDDFTVTASADSGLNVVFSTSGNCSVLDQDGGSATITGNNAGSCEVFYDQAGNYRYNPAPQQSDTVVLKKRDQALIVSAPASSSHQGAAPFNAAASASSGLPVSISTSGSCSGSGNNSISVTPTALGDCTIDYVQGGNNAYNTAPSEQRVVTISKGSQTITVTQGAPSQAGYNELVTVAAEASSALDVAITVNGDCSIVSGGQNQADIRMTALGSCEIAYNQPGNVLSDPAPEVLETVNIVPAAQTINVTTSAPASIENFASFNVAATASSGLPVDIEATGDCSGSGTGSITVQADNAGSCTVTYSQPGNSNYLPASDETENVTVTLYNQTITVTQSAPSPSFVGDTVDVAATASSGLPVSIAVSGGCDIDAGGTDSATIELVSEGSCTVTFSQGGDASYEPADDVEQGIAVVRTAQQITVVVAAPTTGNLGDVFSVSATADSGLPVQITVSNACQLQSGGEDVAEIMLVADTGTCRVYFNQPGNNVYYPAATKQNDLAIATVATADTVGDYWTTQRLFTAKTSAAADPQPITSAPMVARDGSVRAPQPNLMVVFGTGQYLEETDLGDMSMQSIYGVHDRGVYDLNRYTLVDGGRTMLEPRIFTEDEFTVAGETMINRQVNGDDVDLSVQFGWYAELASDINEDGQISSGEQEGERSVFRPFLANQLFVFNSVIPVVGSCTGATQGWTMLMDWTTGKAPGFATYDANLDGSIDSADIGYAGYFNETAGSELGRGGDNIYDSSGNEARRQEVNFGVGDQSYRLGWEEKQPYGLRPGEGN